MKSAFTHLAFLGLSLLFLAIAPSAFAKNIYVAQSAAGADSGANSANAHSAAWFNAAGNWGYGATQIAPGDTVHLCGTISSALAVQSSGTSGNAITILFEPGASLSAPYWTASGAISVNQKDYITIDGGTNGIIQATANGTALTYQNDSNGIVVTNSSNLTIRNLTIQNMYVRESGDLAYSGTNDKDGITFKHPIGFSNITINNNVISDCFAGIAVGYGVSGVSNIYIYSNNLYRCDWGIGGGDTSAGSYGTNWVIHDNLFHDWGNWDTASNAYHHNGIYIWSAAVTSYLDGYYVYNNTFGPGYTNHNTAGFFGGGNYINASVYNNLFVEAPADSHPMDGFLYGSPLSTTTLTLSNRFYNNTFIGQHNGETAISCAYGQTAGTGSQFVVQNNLIYNCSSGISQSYAGNMTLSADNNLYYAAAGMQFSFSTNGTGRFYTWSGWQRLGFDLHGVFGIDPILDGSYRPQLGSPAIAAGVNLASFFTLDLSGKPRPSSGSWDIGALVPLATEAAVKPNNVVTAISIR